MPITSNDVANQALQYIGDNQPAVTGESPTFDNSTAGKALQKFYAPVVATVQRQWGWDASRNTADLTLTGNTPYGWLYEYLYPSNGIQVWQVIDPANTDANNPLPVNWNEANTTVAGAQKKVIQTNVAAAKVVYNNNPGPDIWDPLFREAVVRLLASVCGMAIAGKPDTAQSLLESGGAFESLAESRAN